MHKIQILLAQRFPALGSRDFAIFWVGHLTSLIGTSMQNTALPLLAYRISGRPFDLGLIGFAVTLPTFFLALPGGVLIEHVDKRKAIIFLQTIMMLDTFALAILALSGFIQIWHIVITSLILGIATAFEITARQAMLIELVGENPCRMPLHCNPQPSTCHVYLGLHLQPLPSSSFQIMAKAGYFFSMESASSPSLPVCFLCRLVTSHQCCTHPPNVG